MRYGYYVEGMYFSLNYAQALARAHHLADMYGRGVSVMFRFPTGAVETTVTVYPRQTQPSAA